LKTRPHHRIKRKGQADASADGALLDNYGMSHGLLRETVSPPDTD